ncbi:MAG: DUF5916 domain-containing protein [Saprospiraceae bacterium]
MHYLFIIGLSLGLVFSNSLKAQLNYPQIKIQKAKGKILVDGLFDEEDWKSVEIAKNFKLCFPIDSAFSPWQTEARMVFDEDNLYVAYRCYENRADYIIQSLKRDFEGGTTDVINIILDPFKDGLNGFIFSVSPYNVQREGTIIEGNDLNLIWDNKWYSKVKNYEDHWDVEVAIPFKSLRYKLSNSGQENHWGLNFVRTKLKNFETNTWAPIPSIYNPATLAFAGDLFWVDPPPNPGRNISFIPYINGGYSEDFVRSEQYKFLKKESNYTKAIGADAKIAVTPGLNLDLTVNPDFSQVEVDEQVANVSRFELFFPETRQFFVENQDLFARFGFPSSRPFFSRRLGIAYNPLTGENSKIPILAGVRLSGKINNKLRIGLLNMLSKEKSWDSLNILPGNNVSVLTLQHRIFSRSTISGIYVDKENFLNNLRNEQTNNFQKYNRVAGLEYNLFSKNNKWEGEAYYHRSFSPIEKNEGSSYASFLSYSVKSVEARFGHVSIDSFYTADEGFIPRQGVKQFITGINYNIWPKNSKSIRKYIVGMSNDYAFNWNWKALDYNFNPFVGISFNEQSYIGIGLDYNYIYLYNSFDPTGGLIEVGESELPIGEYKTIAFNLEANTGNSFKLQGDLNLIVGQYFKGSQINLSGNIKCRIQPIGTISMSFDFYQIKQERPFPSAYFFLLGPKAELSFSRDLFFSTFFQYNTQINNFNINTRLQWRFAPVSDVYLVYTDNSFAQSIDPNVRFLSTKNRAIVLKAVYWLNI